MPAVEEKEKKKLMNLFERLSPPSRHEVVDFADYLAHRHGSSLNFPQTTIDEAAGCLFYQGPAKSIQEMDNAVSTRIREKWTKQ